MNDSQNSDEQLLDFSHWTVVTVQVDRGLLRKFLRRLLYCEVLCSL